MILRSNCKVNTSNIVITLGTDSPISRTAHIFFCIAILANIFFIYRATFNFFYLIKSEALDIARSHKKSLDPIIFWAISFDLAPVMVIYNILVVFITFNNWALFSRFKSI